MHDSTASTQVLCPTGLSTVLCGGAGRVTLNEVPAMMHQDSIVNRNQEQQSDRRHSDRFPIEREVRYRVLSKRSGEESGDGKTINISSSGVLFTSEHILLP